MPKPIDTLRFVLLPLSWLYGLVVFIRNKCYDWKIFTSHSFSVPVICVGNITVGGTGKTPHIEYLIRRYSGKYKLAVLSRGYGRKTKGFLYVCTTDIADRVGDEPLQMKQKFPEITFAVDADRRNGVGKLEQDGYTLVLLDDAFQHRAIKPSHSIVLMDYNRLPSKDAYLPTGNLRDGRYAVKRATTVIITKCPEEITNEEKKRILQKNAVKQPAFFSHITYDIITPYFQNKVIPSLKGMHVLLVTGIASPKPLKEYLEAKGAKISMLSYPDHYDFSIRDVERAIKEFSCLEKNKAAIILTTEKDKVKLLPLLENHSQRESFYYLPIKIAFEDGEADKFDSILKL